MAKLLVRALDRYMRIIFKDFTSKNVDSSLLRGKVKASDIQLNEEFVAELLQFPNLEVQTAHCSKLAINISWASIRSKPIQIHLGTVEVVVVEPEELKPCTTNLLQKLKGASSSDDDDGSGGMKFNFVLKTLCGIELVVDRINLTLRLRGCHVAHVPSALTVHITGIHAFSSTESWEKADLTRSFVSKNKREVEMFKVVSIDHVAIGLTGVPQKTGYLHATSSPSPSTELYTLLSVPLQLNAAVTFRRKDAQVLAVHGKCTLDELCISLKQRRMPDAANVILSLVQCLLRKRAHDIENPKVQKKKRPGKPGASSNIYGSSGRVPRVPYNPSTSVEDEVGMSVTDDEYGERDRDVSGTPILSPPRSGAASPRMPATPSIDMDTDATSTLADTVDDSYSDIASSEVAGTDRDTYPTEIRFRLVLKTLLVKFVLDDPAGDGSLGTSTESKPAVFVLANDNHSHHPADASGATGGIALDVDLDMTVNGPLALDLFLAPVSFRHLLEAGMGELHLLKTSPLDPATSPFWLDLKFAFQQSKSATIQHPTVVACVGGIQTEPLPGSLLELSTMFCNRRVAEIINAAPAVAALVAAAVCGTKEGEVTDCPAASPVGAASTSALSLLYQLHARVQLSDILVSVPLAAPGMKSLVPQNDRFAGIDYNLVLCVGRVTAEASNNVPIPLLEDVDAQEETTVPNDPAGDETVGIENGGSGGAHPKEQRTEGRVSPPVSRAEGRLSIVGEAIPQETSNVLRVGGQVTGVKLQIVEATSVGDVRSREKRRKSSKISTAGGDPSRPELPAPTILSPLVVDLCARVRNADTVDENGKPENPLHAALHRRGDAVCVDAAFSVRSLNVLLDRSSYLLLSGCVDTYAQWLIRLKKENPMLDVAREIKVALTSAAKRVQTDMHTNHQQQMNTAARRIVDTTGDTNLTNIEVRENRGVGVEDAANPSAGGAAPLSMATDDDLRANDVDGVRVGGADGLGGDGNGSSDDATVCSEDLSFDFFKPMEVTWNVHVACGALFVSLCDEGDPYLPQTLSVHAKDAAVLVHGLPDSSLQVWSLVSSLDVLGANPAGWLVRSVSEPTGEGSEAVRNLLGDTKETLLATLERGKRLSGAKRQEVSLGVDSCVENMKFVFGFYLVDRPSDPRPEVKVTINGLHFGVPAETVGALVCWLLHERPAEAVFSVLELLFPELIPQSAPPTASTELPPPAAAAAFAAPADDRRSSRRGSKSSLLPRKDSTSRLGKLLSKRSSRSLPVVNASNGSQAPGTPLSLKGIVEEGKRMLGSSPTTSEDDSVTREVEIVRLSEDLKQSGAGLVSAEPSSKAAALQPEAADPQAAKPLHVDIVCHDTLVELAGCAGDDECVHAFVERMEVHIHKGALQPTMASRPVNIVAKMTNVIVGIGTPVALVSADTAAGIPSAPHLTPTAPYTPPSILPSAATDSARQLEAIRRLRDSQGHKMLDLKEALLDCTIGEGCPANPGEPFAGLTYKTTPSLALAITYSEFIVVRRIGRRFGQQAAVIASRARAISRYLGSDPVELYTAIGVAIAKELRGFEPPPMYDPRSVLLAAESAKADPDACLLTAWGHVATARSATARAQHLACRLSDTTAALAASSIDPSHEDEAAITAALTESSGHSSVGRRFLKWGAVPKFARKPLLRDSAEECVHYTCTCYMYSDPPKRKKADPKKPDHRVGVWKRSFVEVSGPKLTCYNSRRKKSILFQGVLEGCEVRAVDKGTSGCLELKTFELLTGRRPSHVVTRFGLYRAKSLDALVFSIRLAASQTATVDPLAYTSSPLSALSSALSPLAPASPTHSSTAVAASATTPTTGTGVAVADGGPSSCLSPLASTPVLAVPDRHDRHGERDSSLPHSSVLRTAVADLFKRKDRHSIARPHVDLNEAAHVTLELRSLLTDAVTTLTTATTTDFPRVCGAGLEKQRDELASARAQSVELQRKLMEQQQATARQAEEIRILREKLARKENLLQTLRASTAGHLSMSPLTASLQSSPRPTPLPAKSSPRRPSLLPRFGSASPSVPSLPPSGTASSTYTGVSSSDGAGVGAGVQNNSTSDSVGTVASFFSRRATGTPPSGSLAPPEGDGKGVAGGKRKWSILPRRKTELRDPLIVTEGNSSSPVQSPPPGEE
eukprot:Rmarinus@m.2380